LDEKWTGSTIYCSKITKKLLIDLIKVPEQYIQDLEMNQTHIMNIGECTFNVTLLDANHCPGAVMFLFECELFGNILATGDFRYSPDMFSPDSLLLNKEIELCYLDNTYFEKRFAKLPSRDEALKQIIQLIQTKQKQYPKKQSGAKLMFKVLLRNLGKEDLLSNLAYFFQTKIVCAKVRYARYINVLGLDANLFSSKFEEDSFIVAQNKFDNVNEKWDEIEGFSGEFPFVITIEPSALQFQTSFYDDKPADLRKLGEYYSKSNENYFRIAYTDHSSYTEIIEFVKELKPKGLIPIGNANLILITI
jgi:predicted metal-dependent RNase